MQLFGGRATESPAEFWRKTAEKRGGPIGFVSFATYLGASGSGIQELSGLLYDVGGTIWFEDFERDNWLSRIVRSRTSYEKTEFSFSRADARFARMVRRRGALRALTGPSEDALAPATFWSRVFSTPILQVKMKDGSSLFFDLLLKKEFLALFPRDG